MDFKSKIRNDVIQLFMHFGKHFFATRGQNSSSDTKKKQKLFKKLRCKKVDKHMRYKTEHLKNKKRVK